MKKYILSFLLIGTFGLYVLYLHTGSNAAEVAPTASLSISSLIKTPVGNKAPIIASSGQYKDGTYTGISANAYYGNIQIEAVINGGKLADVQFLDYPRDRRTSIRINNQAMPFLKQEAIHAQSANVDTVSGASDSSGAFRQSLASALSQAKKI